MYTILYKKFVKRLYHANYFVRMKSILIVAEHNNKTLTPITLNTIEAAKEIGGDLTVLVAGTKCHTVAKSISNIKQLKRVLVAEDAAFDGFAAENLTPLILATQKQFAFTHIMAGSTTFGNSVLPRVAAKLDVPVITDITDVKSSNIFVRPIYAGNAFMTLKAKDPVKVLTVRETGFATPEHHKLHSTLDVVMRAMSLCKVQVDRQSKQKMVEYLRLKRAADSISQWKILTGEDYTAPIEEVCTEKCNPGLTIFLKKDLTKCKRSKLAKAKIVICGGKGMKSKNNFKLLYSLAEKVNGEVGACRTAVDAGYASRELEIGQIGTTVAPDLYIGVGVSGEPEHLAGIKNSKTIVAINKNPNAPIFEMADYGLVADLFEVLLQLHAKLK